MMEFDAFISYSSRDKTAADAACAVLESTGVRCWIAPRDIRPGVEYGTAIIDAIEQCRVMVLIFSSSANESRQIHREIERVVSKGIPIVPVRIEDVVPTKSMEYFLGAIHWLDALTPPLEGHLQRLAETVKAILQVDAAAQARSDNLTPVDKTAAAAGAKATQFLASDQPRADARSKKKLTRAGWALGASAIAAAIFLMAGGLWIYQTRVPAPTNAPAAQASQPEQRQPPPLVPETVPFIRDRDRAAIRSEYLGAPEHKALAISFNRMGFITGQQDDETAKRAALANCTKATEAAGSKNPCEIYAVGNNVVFTGGNPPMPPSPWLIRNPSIERPFASKDIPLASDSQRASIERAYAPAAKPKAFALAPDGDGFYYRNVASAEEAIRKALEACGHRAGVACMIVAVDDLFVVPIPLKMKATGFFFAGSNVAIAPELRDSLTRRLGNATNAWNAIAVGANGRPGLVLNAADEDAAIEGALTDCGRQDRNCRVIALGPFSVEPLPAPKPIEQNPSPLR
jgi:hypothetical protein